MAEVLQKIALGGGCHWCIEAVFQMLKGVTEVKQGYVASTGENCNFSEAVIVHFNPKIIPLHRLIEIHLRTHNSTSNHSFRKKYRSAVYYFNQKQKEEGKIALRFLQNYFEEKIITKAIPFREFKASREAIQDYYQKDPEKPFCKNYIDPKLKLILREFSENMKKH
ncbi:peptide-methionine (S)-S-oxide reductase [Autumnicola musiva]|uniref:peptide-methionine (S)-S-oxide reductase n=1 Tax=Autumnicola musiva TaxID=3075589 RepID=A0ABU3D6H6_9FLAO|nr:peptide-methionine (S)-S-oxide reductase [Zunongwangia sp. F117]MDT0676984.1 peptide-methionine (S)-S-oxide reductase [Zunongwangia sp. F117]